MVALFVVLTVVLFLTLDLILAARNQAGLAGALTRQTAAEIQPPEIVSGFSFAHDRAYHPGHTWARLNANAVARVGVDDFGARLVGPAEAIDVVEPGTAVRAGDAIAVVTRRGRKAAFVAPVSGVVRAINRSLLSRPSDTVGDPYGDGWICEIKAQDLRRDLRALASGETARRWLDESATTLHRMFMPAEMLPVAADGGRALEAVSDQLDEEAWNRARAEFLLAEVD